MPTPEERRWAVDRVLAENPYEDNPQLWIFMIYICLIFRKDGRVSFAFFIVIIAYIWCEHRGL